MLRFRRSIPLCAGHTRDRSGGEDRVSLDAHRPCLRSRSVSRRRICLHREDGGGHRVGRARYDHDRRGAAIIRRPRPESTKPVESTAEPHHQQNQQQQAAPANQATTADIGDVTRHPDKYLNKAVTVEGEATDVLGPHLFVIDAKKLLHLWGGMVVVVVGPFAAVIRRDSPVRVTGTVESFTWRSLG